MKFRVNITETLTLGVITEASSYEEADAKVREAYHNTEIVLMGDNASVDTEFEVYIANEDDMKYLTSIDADSEVLDDD